MNKIKWKKIVSVAKTEYVKWICNSRMILLLMLWVFMNEAVMKPLLLRADKMEQPINFAEPFLAVGNSKMLVLLLPIVYLTLISDFPKMDGNTFFVLERVGRKNWLLGQMLHSIWAFFTFIAMVFLETIITVASKSYVYNGWSLVVTDYEILYPEAKNSGLSQMLPKNLYNQMPPYRALFLTIVFMALYMLLLSMIMLLFQILKKKVLGFVCCCSLITLGAALCALKSKVMWSLPMAHSIVWMHYPEFYRKLIMPIYVSLIYFAVLIGTIFICCLCAIEHTNFDTIQELD